jgi:hypothetical protein
MFHKLTCEVWSLFQVGVVPHTVREYVEVIGDVDV